MNKIRLFLNHLIFWAKNGPQWPSSFGSERHLGWWVEKLHALRTIPLNLVSIDILLFMFKRFLKDDFQFNYFNKRYLFWWHIGKQNLLLKRTFTLFEMIGSDCTLSRSVGLKILFSFLLRYVMVSISISLYQVWFQWTEMLKD